MRLSISLFLLFSIFNISASTSSTADRAEQPIAVSTSSVVPVAINEELGVNISVVVPRAGEEVDLKEYVFLGGVYPFLLNSANKACILMPAKALIEMRDEVTDKLDHMVEMVQTIHGYTSRIPVDIIGKDECIKKIQEMAEENYPDTWNVYFDNCPERNTVIACRLSCNAIKKRYKIYQLSEHFVLLVPKLLLDTVPEDCVAKRTRYSLVESLKDKGLIIPQRSEIALEQVQVPATQVLIKDSLPQVLEQLLIQRDDKAPLCKLMFYGHGSFDPDRPDQGSLVGMPRNKFKKILRLLNNKSVAAVGYKTCHTGQQLPEIEKLQLCYDLAAIVDSGIVWVVDELATYFPLMGKHLPGLLQVDQGRYTLCPEKRLLLSQIFTQLRSGTLSSYDQTCGMKPAGEKEFVPRGVNVTPLKAPVGKFNVRVVTDKAMYPAKQYVDDTVAYSAQSAEIKSKYKDQVYKKICLEGVDLDSFLDRVKLKVENSRLYVQELQCADGRHLKDVVVVNGVNETMPKAVFYTESDGSKYLKYGSSSRECGVKDLESYKDRWNIAREIIAREKTELGVKRKISFATALEKTE